MEDWEPEDPAVDRSRKIPFMHFDSSRESGEVNRRNAIKLAKRLSPLLGIPKDLAERALLTTEKCPQQTNGSDCGAYVCNISEALASGKSAFVVRQADMAGFRKRFAGDIRKRATKKRGYD